MCNKFSICEIVLGVLVIAVAFWKTLPYQEWVLTLLGVLLILHSFVCKMCKCNCDECEVEEKPKKATRARRRK